MQFKEWLQTTILNESIKEISYAEAMNQNMFGPVYHGTTEENSQAIKKTGFNIFIGAPRKDNITHGYTLEKYDQTPYPAPVHHLGYGVYFTTNKNSAKMYNRGTTKGLQEYFLNVPRMETINFASTKKMMDWWRKNGYNMDESMDENKRIQATVNMTNNLKEKYDAVYFKVKGLYRLLDGDQICVFDPQRIYTINPNLSQENEFVPKDRLVIKDTNIIAKVDSVSKNGDIYISYDDPMQKVLQRYGKEFMNNQISIMDDQFIQRITQNTNSNTTEEAIQKYLDYHFPQKQKNKKWPKEWIGKKLKKGERL